MLHALRAPTRGGPASTINEFARVTGLQFVVEEDSLPMRLEVDSFIRLLGLDPLAMDNEGKCLLFVAPEVSVAAFEALHDNPYGRHAAMIGWVEKAGRRGRVIIETGIGTRRDIEMPLEESLPRICL